MGKRTRSVELIGTLLVVTAAFVQWAVLLEQTWAVIWAWYKFYGYGGGGHITVGKDTQLLFYMLSSLTAFIGLIISRLSNNDATSCIQKRLSRIGSFALVTGMLFWTTILMSPLVVFR
jgi:hypothetical protein